MRRVYYGLATGATRQYRCISYRVYVCVLLLQVGPVLEASQALRHIDDPLAANRHIGRCVGVQRISAAMSRCCLFEE